MFHQSLRGVEARDLPLLVQKSLMKKKELAWKGITKGNTNNTITAAREPDLELTKSWGI